MLGGVPDFLGGVPGFLESVPDFWEGVPGFLGGFWGVFRVFGCSVMFRDVPVFRCSVFRCSWKYYMPVFRARHSIRKRLLLLLHENVLSPGQTVMIVDDS